jgi:hypothetical protein
MVRKNRQTETRMVSEYVAKEYKDFTYMLAVPLGRIPDNVIKDVGYTQAIAFMRPYRLEVDAIVVLPRYLVLIEAKVFKTIDGLAKLPLYKSLVPFTPELAKYAGYEVIMELVVGWTNPNLEIMCRDAGVRLKVYSPDWLAAVVQEYHKYWTKEYRDTRNQKLELRTYYGIE